MYLVHSNILIISFCKFLQLIAICSEFFFKLRCIVTMENSQGTFFVSAKFCY